MSNQNSPDVASNSRIIIVLHIVTQIIRFGGILLIQRLVAPEDYGLMGVVIGVIIGLEMISDIGIGPSIIQNRRGAQPTFYRTAWVLQLGRGVVLMLVALALALTLAWAQQSGTISAPSNYANPSLPPVLMVLSLSLLLSGLNSTSLHVYTRHQKLMKVSVLELYAQIVALVVILIWAWYSPTVWALVAGALTRSVVKAILSYSMFPDISMRWTFDRSDAVQVYRFGRWIFLGSIATFLAQYGDRFFMNAYMTPLALGLYMSAVMLIEVFRTLAFAVQSKVLYPLFGEVHRSNPEQIASTYYRVRLPFDLCLALVTGAIITGSASVIRVAFGDRYFGAAEYVPILVIAMLGIGPALSSSLLAARGFPKAETLYLSLRLLLIVVGLPLCHALFGTDRMVWVVALNTILPLPVLFYFMHKEGLLRGLLEIRGLIALPIGLGLGKLIAWFMDTVFV